MQIWARQQQARRTRKRCWAVWPVDPEAGSQPANFHGWPMQKQFALVLTHDVDTQKGHDCCLDLMTLEQRAGFKSAFNFVPERYRVSPDLRATLSHNGFEIGVHGLRHDGKLFSSRDVFEKRAARINQYLAKWGARGFRAPSMIRNLEWISELAIDYDESTFDTDPFEPQPQGSKTIFPYWFQGKERGFVELPYTLAQDFTLFILLRETTPDIWIKKLQWVADHNGMALLNTHPDYMHFSGKPCAREEYRSDLYLDFLNYIRTNYSGKYWHALPHQVADFWKSLPERNLS
jgi:peptidoglycan/xylan/chitin deacetylase (PgdA/CDA1 family)